jgi:hypothetical protein
MKEIDYWPNQHQNNQKIAIFHLQTTREKSKTSCIPRCEKFILSMVSLQPYPK